MLLLKTLQHRSQHAHAHRGQARKMLRRLLRREGNMGARIARNKVIKRLRDRLQQGSRKRRGGHNAQSIAQTRGILNHRIVQLRLGGTVGSSHVGSSHERECAARAHQLFRQLTCLSRAGVRAVLLAMLLTVVFRVLGLTEILRTVRRSLQVVSPQAQTQLPRAQRTQLTQKIRHALHAAGAVTLTRALQTLLSLHQNRRIQQVAQTARPQQLSQQRRVQRQRGGATFGGGRIAVVEVLGNVLKEQGARKRRRVVRLNLQHGHRPRLQRTVHLNQRRNIVHILQTLARRLQKHRKIGVLARHIQQLRRTLTLLPQWGALTRITARQQQGTRRILTEPRRKKRRIAHAFGDNRLQLVRVEEE